MAVKIVQAAIASPGAFGIAITDSAYAPRYKVGDVVDVDTAAPQIGDEVFCVAANGEIAIGDLSAINGDSIVLSDSCHVAQGSDVTITHGKYWRILGCQFNAASY